MQVLQRGQLPLLIQSSLEHTLQNVCPHGMNAAPFCLTMHTQHTEPTPLPFSSFSSITSSPSLSPSIATVHTSVCSINAINETLAGDTTTSLSSSSSRCCLSAASADARSVRTEYRAGL